ncbi:hypothetical protein N7507_011196 [Penicillium longicatenatum]|nr:hypothetical protein N7507_011196 [Penicillium longicatenatum]
MPPRRRAAANAQSRITFGTQSRVTKPSTTPTTLHKGKDLDSKAPRTTDESASATPEPAQVVAPELSKPHITELAVRQPEPKQIRTPEEEQALKLSLKDLRKYWNEKEPEKDRDRPFRWHQGGVNLEEKILRNFDQSSQYGPCIGMNRTQRWRRAQKLGLNPPIEVLTVLLKGEDIDEISHMEALISR